MSLPSFVVAGASLHTTGPSWADHPNQQRVRPPTKGHLPSAKTFSTSCWSPGWYRRQRINSLRGTVPLPCDIRVREFESFQRCPRSLRVEPISPKQATHGECAGGASRERVSAPRWSLVVTDVVSARRHPLTLQLLGHCTVLTSAAILAISWWRRGAFSQATSA